MLARFHRLVVVAPPEESVADVAGRMRDARVGCVVVTRNEHPIGIVTDRDLALRVVAEGRDPRTTCVGEVMSEAPMTLEDSHDLATALWHFRQSGVRRLPLVSAEGKLVGMVTSDDLVLLLAEELAQLATGIENGVDAPEVR